MQFAEYVAPYPRKHSYLVFALVSLILVSACAPSPLVPESLPRSYLAGKNGLLVGSIARAAKDWPFHHYAIFYRRLGTTQTRLIEVEGERYGYWRSGAVFNDDFTEGDVNSSLIVHSLPPGTYEIYRYYLRWQTGPQERLFYSTDDFSLRFIIRPGQISYIGEIIASSTNFDERLSSWLIGEDVRGVWALRNRADRDLSMLKAIFPEINIAKTVQLLPKGCADIERC